MPSVRPILSELLHQEDDMPAAARSRRDWIVDSALFLFAGTPGHGLAIEVCNPSPALATGGSKIPGTGAGLLGLAERAMLSGGRLEHGLDEDGHFRLSAWLPWPK